MFQLRKSRVQRAFMQSLKETMLMVTVQYSTYSSRYVGYRVVTASYERKTYL